MGPSAGFMRKSFSQNWSKAELWTQKCQIKNWVTKDLTGAAHNIKLSNQQNKEKASNFRKLHYLHKTLFVNYLML